GQQFGQVPADGLGARCDRQRSDEAQFAQWRVSPTVVTPASWEEVQARRCDNLMLTAAPAPAASPMHRDMMPPSIDAAATVTCAGVTAASRQASPRVGDPADAGDSPRSRRAAGARYPVGHLLRPGELGGSITCCTAADSGPPFDLPLLLHVR